MEYMAMKVAKKRKIASNGGWGWRGCRKRRGPARPLIRSVKFPSNITSLAITLDVNNELR